MLALTVLAGANDALVSHKLRQLEAGFDSSVVPQRLYIQDSPPLKDLLGAQSLFGTPRTLILHDIDVSALEIIEAAHETSSAVVIATFSNRLTPKISARITSLGHLEKIPTPTTLTQRATLFSQLAKDYGIAISPAISKSIMARLVDDWPRALSIISQLHISGSTSPSLELVNSLAGSAAPAVTPWEVTADLTSGRIPDALKKAPSLEPVPLASWVTQETMLLAQLSENTWDSQTAQRELSLAPFRVARLISLARRLTPQSRADLIAAAAEMTLSAKSADANSLMLSALVKWSSVFSTI